VTELVEPSADHSRKQLEMMAEQTKDLSGAQNLGASAAVPVASAFGQGAAMMVVALTATELWRPV
jgi:hypothetical protein